ncbi:hypothetical protein BJ170DRAFT_595836 [Xylariales sp. AK1849]|nr:hypothetical protein BJ170DRAFT_595836 [Xylariales sp. AK1849]
MTPRISSFAFGLSCYALGIIAIGQNVALAPPGHDFPSCTARSEAPTSFKVQGFQYHHGTSSPAAQLKFDLTNVANNHTSHCNMTSDQFALNHGNSENPAIAWTACEDADMVKISELYDISTLVKFDSNSTNLIVNQTWYCDDVNPEYPIAFFGQSKGQISNFTCTSSDATAENDPLEKAAAGQEKGPAAAEGMVGEDALDEAIGDEGDDAIAEQTSAGGDALEEAEAKKESH